MDAETSPVRVLHHEILPSMRSVRGQGSSSPL